MDVKKILCPIDFSPTSQRALAVAVSMARRFGAELELLHVYQTPAAPGASGSASSAARAVSGHLAAAHSELLRWCKEANPGGEVTSRARVIDGTPHVEILRAAKSGTYDLVVMGTLGRTGLTRLVLGSVAERVVRESPCPVLTVREPSRGPVNE
jgi:universal stress protein A